MKTILLAGAVAAVAAASPAAAVTNVLKNGSFEAGAGTGTNRFTNWTKTNIAPAEPATVISYNSNSSYPNGAFGEMVLPDNIANSGSPDAVGSYAAYFVGNRSVNETLSQLTYLGVGNYRVGFSYYLPQNGLNNINNASFDATIIGVKVASTMINSSSLARTWLYATGVAQITQAGHYNTALVFNSNGNPAKDIVVDRVFASRTLDAATVMIPPTPVSVPEPATWGLLLVGFGMVGTAARRRKVVIAA
jgi:hypothetical protein